MTFKKFFKTVKQSLKGKEHDYTKGDISDAVILLAVPMILELGLESVFAIVDMFFVSKLGAAAIATVGLTESVVTLVYSVAVGLSTGATAVVARRVGEKHFEAASHAGAQSILLSVAVSVVLGVLGAVFAGDILHLMGASPDVIRDGTSFARIMLGGSPVIVLLFLINGIFRGAGDAAMAMKSLWIASGMNIVLCPVFIHAFGLKGAALATLVGRSSGVLYQCTHLKRGDGVLKMKSRHFAMDLPIVKSLAEIAWPATFQFLIGSGSWILLTRLVAETGGTEASAGYQIAFRNFVFFILPAWGLSNAAATLVGQNLGAKEYGRAEQSVYLTAKYSGFLMAFVTAFFLVFAGALVRFFTTDPTVVEHGTLALQLIGSGFIFYGVGMVMTQALNGAGDTRTPSWINFICYWVIQTPLAYALAKTLGLGAKGTIVTIPFSNALVAGVAWFYFRRGRWKKVKV